MSDQLWAPWRLDYILRDSSDDPASDERPADSCFLCDHAAADPVDDEANLVIHRGERAFVLLNRYPYNNGHLLIAPLGHLADPTDLDDETLFETVSLVRRMVGVLREAMSPEGFNVGLNLGRVAGAGLPGHLHWHIVPRWNGDTNFMPVVGNVDVIPQSLASACAHLRSHLGASPASSG